MESTVVLHLIKYIFAVCVCVGITHMFSTLIFLKLAASSNFNLHMLQVSLNILFFLLLAWQVVCRQLIFTTTYKNALNLIHHESKSNFEQRWYMAKFHSAAIENKLVQSEELVSPLRQALLFFIMSPSQKKKYSKN